MNEHLRQKINEYRKLKSRLTELNDYVSVPVDAAFGFLSKAKIDFRAVHPYKLNELQLTDWINHDSMSEIEDISDEEITIKCTDRFDNECAFPVRLVHLYYEDYPAFCNFFGDLLKEWLEKIDSMAAQNKLKTEALERAQYESLKRKFA